MSKSIRDKDFYHVRHYVHHSEFLTEEDKEFRDLLLKYGVKLTRYRNPYVFYRHRHCSDRKANTKGEKIFERSEKRGKKFRAKKKLLYEELSEESC